MVYRCDSNGRIEVLALGNFDNLPGDEIAVLDTCHITMLQPDSYQFKSKTEFKQHVCDQCVHMYPYLVPDGKGSTLVSTSDGVSDINGHLLWKWEAEGFSRVVPIQSLLEQPNFVSYQYLTISSFIMPMENNYGGRKAMCLILDGTPHPRVTSFYMR